MAKKNIPENKKGLNKFKYEISQEMGLSKKARQKMYKSQEKKVNSKNNDNCK